MNDNAPENPRIAIGGNNPPIIEFLRLLAEEKDFGISVSDYLKEKYAEHIKQVSELLDEAREIVRPLPDAAEKAKVVGLIKRMRDLKKKLVGLHELEKAPFWNGGKAADQVFFGPIGKLAKEKRDEKDGAVDILGRALTDYDNRILAEEQAERRRVADEAARVAREEAEEAERLRQEAELRRLEAERARKPEIVEAKKEVAVEAEKAAGAASVEATVTLARAEEAHIATLARPADIMRERFDDGVMSTMGQEKYAVITDRTKLDLEKLAPFISIKALETALTGWARNTDYREKMPGADVGRRNKSKVL